MADCISVSVFNFCAVIVKKLGYDLAVSFSLQKLWYYYFSTIAQ